MFLFDFTSCTISASSFCVDSTNNFLQKGIKNPETLLHFTVTFQDSSFALLFLHVYPYASINKASFIKCFAAPTADASFS